MNTPAVQNEKSNWDMSPVVDLIHSLHVSPAAEDQSNTATASMEDNDASSATIGSESNELYIAATDRENHESSATMTGNTDQPNYPTQPLNANAPGLALDGATEVDNHDGEVPQLGDLSNVLAQFHVQSHIPGPTLPPFESGLSASRSNPDSYASDGALNYPPSTRRASWVGESDGVELSEANIAQSLHHASNENTEGLKQDDKSGSVAPKLTKTQRKKRNRMRRRQSGGPNDTTPQTSEPENRQAALTNANNSQGKSKKQMKYNNRYTPYDNPSISPVPGSRYNLRQPRPQISGGSSVQVDSNLPAATGGENPSIQAEIGTNVPSQESAAGALMTTLHGYYMSESDSIRKFHPASSYTMPNTVPISSAEQPQTVSNGKIAVDETKAEPLPPVPTFPCQGPPPQPLEPAPGTVPSQTTLAIRSNDQPSQIAGSTGGSSRARDQQTAQASASHSTLQRPTPRHEVGPRNQRLTGDVHFNLWMKLIHDFPADHRFLVAPSQLTPKAAEAAGGIHVFVDASNIFIGFTESLKAQRGAPHIEPGKINFHALALILERRRPVTKRVLAGSLPEVPAFEQARDIGYETHILSRVPVQTTLNPSQRRESPNPHRPRDLAQLPLRPAPPPPPRQTRSGWREQGVDELLHLKMMESLIDSQPVENPQLPLTVVIATGDAAAAEHSEGFMAMTSRFLKKGWHVEVVAWRTSISSLYSRLEKTPVREGGWGDMFKVIELDGFMESLCGRPAASVTNENTR